MSPEQIRLLVVDDEDAFRMGLCERLKRKKFITFEASSGKDAIAIAGENLLDVAVVDIRMPEMDGMELLARLKEAHPSIEVIIFTGAASMTTAIEAMKLGAYDYVSKPFNFDELVLLIQKAFGKKQLWHKNLVLEKELKRLTATGELIGSSPKMLDIRQFIARAAQADSPVLIEGESGVGKELVAREIHRQSPRANAPFVVLDCGAFPETLLANELLGHDRGAFTTAMDSRPGLLEIADGGTLLIDEIGEMTPVNQASLLRVVETSKFRRLGASKEMQVNVRIIASTNRNLRNEILQGRFRQDLFYRLEVLHFVVPPLRERKEDIPLLSEYFLDCLNRAKGAKKQLNPEQKILLMSHRWPGNIRELANLIERDFFLSSGDELKLADFGINSASDPQCKTEMLSESQTLSQIESEHILRVLIANKGNKKETARALGISRSRLYNLLKKYKISSEEI